MGGVEKEYYSELKDIILSHELQYPDQDILNILFEKDRILLDKDCNYQIRNWSIINDDINSAKIVHYVSVPKPWNINYDNEYGKLWWYYFSKLNWKNGYIKCLLIYKMKRILYRMINKLK